MILAYMSYLLLDRSRVAPTPVLQWFPQAVQWSFVYGVPIEIIMAVIWQESTGDFEALGDRNTSFGLMQVKQIAVDDLINEGYNVRPVPVIEPIDNIKQGVAFLHLIRSKLGNPQGWYNVLRSYNCCGTNVRKVINNPTISKKYADEVLTKARALGYGGS